MWGILYQQIRQLENWPVNYGFSEGLITKASINKKLFDGLWYIFTTLKFIFLGK